MAHEKDIQSKRVDYVSKLYDQEPIFQEIEVFLEEKRWAIQVNKSFGRLMSVLVAMFQPKKIVEIGTLVGYSALWIAKNMEKGSVLWTIEKDPARALIAKEFINNSSWGDRIISLTGEAKAVLEDIKKEGLFDMVFIDANKASYLDYLDWAEENLRKGGVIIADNTFLNGSLYGAPTKKINEKTAEKMQEFNRRLAAQEKFLSVCLPLFDGFFIAIKK